MTTASSSVASPEVGRHRVLRSHGSFVLNYRSKRQRGERGVLQYELVFWLREQGFVFAEDFIWGKPSPPPGRFNRFLKDAVESLLPGLYKVYPDMHVDLVTCYAGVPAGYAGGEVYRVGEYSGPEGRKRLYAILAERKYSIIGIRATSSSPRASWSASRLG